MGTSNSAEEFVDKILRAAAELSKQDRPQTSKALRDAATAAVKVEKASMASAVGADMRMGKMKLGVRYDIVSNGIIVKATGPAHLIERDTSAHWIAPKAKRGGRTRRRNARLLDAAVVAGALGGGGMAIGAGLGRRRTGIRIPPKESGWSMYARHPGTHGKHPFERGMYAARTPAAIAYQRAVIADLAKVFG